MQKVFCFSQIQSESTKQEEELLPPPPRPGSASGPKAQPSPRTTPPLALSPDDDIDGLIPDADTIRCGAHSCQIAL
jgi:hypothetical protein